jgi:hypothetical protein
LKRTSRSKMALLNMITNHTQSSSSTLPKSGSSLLMKPRFCDWLPSCVKSNQRAKTLSWHLICKRICLRFMKKQRSWPRTELLKTCQRKARKRKDEERGTDLTI